jgi:aminoglycoside/choline kinase family phosphotransferase
MKHAPETGGRARRLIKSHCNGVAARVPSWHAPARARSMSAAIPRSPEPTDPRRNALADWIGSELGTRAFTLVPASEDASFRRYFRVTPAQRWRDHTTLIAMDAPPPMEDCRPYVHVASLMRAAGVNAPEVFAADIDRGFLLLTDLGACTYLDALDEASANELYISALDSLVRWQRASREGELARYDEARLARELALFPDWYVARHLRVTLTSSQRATLDEAFRRVLDRALAQPAVYVHRDYHSRNLMVCADNPGVLDFQDAVYGPITYDLVSLLRDAYISWDEERQIDWAVRYWERARRAELPVDADFATFWSDFEWMGVQRQLKVLGIFARLCYRDGKTRYLDDMPRVSTYLRGACSRYAALAPLVRLLDEIEGRERAVGVTF